MTKDLQGVTPSNRAYPCLLQRGNPPVGFVVPAASGAVEI
jgi:hypothetical protein